MKYRAMRRSDRKQGIAFWDKKYSSAIRAVMSSVRLFDKKISMCFPQSHPSRNIAISYCKQNKAI